MRQCTKCGRRFAATDRVCPDDGTLLTDTMSFEEQAVGKTLEGKYRIDGFLKRGGMGAVYRGTHLMLGKPVAIKLIKPELVSSNDVVERFLREARAAAHLTHPNIVTVHDLGQTPDGMLYIAMELVDGSSLKELVVSEGAWEPKRAVRLLKGIGSALALAHRKGVVHRDLKPQNIMVCRGSDGDEVPKLLDFGIAKTFEPTSPALTSTGMVLGTPHYMSSEQAKGLPADQRSDLYALGVILYEMLVGKVPFDDTSIPQILIKHLSEPPKPPSTLNASIPPELEAVVMRCLEKDPERRYQSAEELMAALDGIRDTAVRTANVPTMAAAPNRSGTVTELDSPARDTTMAGAAAVAAPPPPIPSSTAPAMPSSTGTLRAHEVRVRESRAGSRLLLAGIVVVVLGLAAWFLLRGRGAEPAASQVAETASPSPPEASSSPSLPAATPLARDPEPESESEPAMISEPTVSASSQPARSAERVGSVATTPPAPPRAEPRVETRNEPQAAPAPPPPPPLPETPTVSVACAGVNDGCAAMRFAVTEELRKQGIPTGQPGSSDVFLQIAVEELEARQETQFGTTFVTRTYSIESTATSPHFGDEALLEPRMLSFDARLGRDKLQEQSRVIASGVVDAVKQYWARNSR